MSVARLELVRIDDGTIVLRTADADGAVRLSEPEVLLTLKFNDRLTELLGADALTLAQSMVVSASHVFEYGVRTEEDPLDGTVPVASEQAAYAAVQGQEDDADLGAGSDSELELELEEESVVRLRTATLH